MSSSISESAAEPKIEISGNVSDEKDRQHSVGSCELESLRTALKQAELKLQLLRRRYEEELSQFNETRVERILRNSGAIDYFERLKDRTKINHDIIKNLREDLEFKSKEVLELKNRCKEVEKQNQEYLRAWKEAQAARDRLEMEKNSSKVSYTYKDRRSCVNQSVNMSSASSIDYQVPPPPQIDAPSIEEIFRFTSSMHESDPYNSLDKAIPPPPNIEVPLDEILDVGEEKKPFEQEEGQFPCHLYLNIESEKCQETLSDIIELVEAEQSRCDSKALKDWISLGNRENVFDKKDFHLTLIRGHRAIHYHQIKPLVSAIEAQCKSLKTLDLCLDKLQLFYNNEKTKQFLCLTTQAPDQLGDFQILKNALKGVVDQFADRLTAEDETDDTVPHCSLMSRRVQQVRGPDEVARDLQAIETLCNENLDEYPICCLKVDTIYMKIGRKIYDFKV